MKRRWPVSELKVDRKLAKLLPDPENIEGLRESIAKHGVLVPLLVTANGLVLDGHRRLSIAKELGLKDVPVEPLDVKAKTWHAAMARLINLHRRHLNEAQRAALGSSLLRIERKKAKERKAHGKTGPGKTLRGTKSRSVEAGGDRATGRVAKQVGVSRHTVERVQAIMDDAPADVQKKVLDGKMSIAGAYSQVQKKRKRKEYGKLKAQPGIYRKAFTSIPKGKYRCIYADPPWQYQWGGERGHVDQHYADMSLDDICGLPVGAIAHPKGAHLWLWTTWPKIRDRSAHAVLEAWGFEWVGEIVWHKGRLGTGYWLRPTTEILILAHTKKLELAHRDQPGHFEAKPRGHSVKPDEAREIIERLSPNPRIELFARKVPDKWAAWGKEARRG